MKSIKSIYKLILKNGGFTKDLKHNSGYMVSVKKFEKTLKIDDFKTFKKLYKEYVKTAKILNAFVGVWVDNNIIYLDISYHFYHYKKAFEYGTQQQQKAIYNIKENKSIYLK